MSSALSAPQFRLVDHFGAAVSEADYRGQYVLAFFGFTHCAMVCPRALSKLSNVLGQLGDHAKDIRALYITVDPERDTPEVMRSFLARQAPVFTGLTGSPAAIAGAKSSFRVFATRKADPTAPGGYTVPHTAITYILDRDGALLDHLGDGLTEDEMLSRVRALLQHGA